MMKGKKISMGDEPFRERSPSLPDEIASPLNITDISQLPKGADDLTPGLVQEKVVIVLFTTRIGLSIMKLLYDLACGRVDMSQHKKWQQHRHQAGTDDVNYKKMVKKWTNSLEYVSRFMDLLLYNANFALDTTKYTQTEYKLAFRSLLDRPNELLLIDNDYNLLLDFLTNVKPLIEGLINEESLPSLLEQLVHKYNRVFEFNGRYTWYTLEPGNFQQSEDLFQKYLAVLTDKLTAQQELIPQLQPLFDAADAHLLVHSSPAVQETSESDTNSDSDHWSQQKSSAQERVYSFDLNNDGTLDVPNVFRHTKFRHQTLFKILNLHEQNTAPMVKSQFLTLCALVDPVTQPTPNDSHIISLDLLSDMFLGFLYSEIIRIPTNWKFHVAFNLQKIIKSTLPRLNCHDFQKLNSVNNSDESVDWRQNLHKWLPHGLNTQDLELVYMVDILAIYTIQKLYQDLPVQMNPFLAPMIALWKNLTFVVLLGLEIDRFEEEQETFNTPVLVRATIRGASALRSVVATVLNGHVACKSHDFKHEPINIFMSPHGRKLCHGALYTDVRSHAAAMLALGTELEDVTGLLSDLQPGDRFDEDVKYMFDYEYDNYNEVDTEEMDEDELEDVESRERIKEMRGYYKRCHCTFDDDEVLVDDEDDDDNTILEKESADEKLTESLPPTSHVSMSNSKKPVAFRSKKESVEFDFNGRDWRDIPRGANLYFTESYLFVDHLYADVVHLLMRKATEHALEKKHSSFLLRSIATCVRREQEQTMLKSVVVGDNGTHNSDGSELISETELTTDFIYEKWCQDSLFEKLEKHNSTLAWRMMDEMLMCSGYRRVLIWFITHLEVNHTMIQYVFELVMGLRGNSQSQECASEDNKSSSDGLLNTEEDEFPFSRQGAISLSDIEAKMLLQEFFTNAAIFFSKHLRESFGDGEEDDYGIDRDIPLQILGLMKLVCIMVKNLMDSEKFDFTDSEYIFELQTLLMSWICIVPEARELFFMLRSQVDAHSNDQLPTPQSPEIDDPMGATQDKKSQAPGDTTDSISKYNEKLISLLPPATENENTAVTALRSFIGKHSLTTKTAVFGRKVIYQDDEVMDLYMSDKEMNCREFLAEFGIDYNDVVNGVYDEFYDDN